MLCKLDIPLMIKQSVSFPKKFSARQVWMLVRQKKKDVNVQEFALKMQSISKKKDNNSGDFEAILEYEVDHRGVRFYSLVEPDQGVIKSKDIINKIKQCMCNCNQFTLPMINENRNIVDKDRNFIEHNFMTENEISEKININIERIRPFVSILIELGVIVIENDLNQEYPQIEEQKIDDNSHDMIQVEFESQEQNYNDHYSEIQKNWSQANNCGELFDNVDLNLHMWHIDNLAINENNDLISKNQKNDINNNQFHIDNNEIYDNTALEVNLCNQKSINEKNVKSKLMQMGNISSRRRIKWDESREMRRKNLSDSFEYLNRLRSMKDTLMSSIVKAKGTI